jgi:hypothetical protein
LILSVLPRNAPLQKSHQHKVDIIVPVFGQ